MKALWVTASPSGPSARILNVRAGTSGGWVQTIYEEIKNQGITLDFLCYSKNIRLGEIRTAVSDSGETVYCLNMPKISFGVEPNQNLKKQVEEVIAKVKPDIIHIWGTETVVQNVVASCANQIPKVVFIQGLIGLHSRYYGGRLNDLGLKLHLKPLELITSIVKKHHFLKQAEYEKKELINAKNVILDNDFSKAYCKAIDSIITPFEYRLNPNNIFEKYEWNIELCKRHKIFTVYGGGPDKGLHQLIRALAIIKQDFQNVEIVIPGSFNTIGNGKLKDSGLSSFERLLKTLINEYDLNDNVTFCGRLDSEGMAKQLQSAHCFVSPSIMEVHAGSLREAMTVGVPSFSTFCGSVIEYLQEGITGWLYRYEEHEVLAYKIIKLFNDDEIAKRVGHNARSYMIKQKNLMHRISMRDIYEKIIEKDQKCT